MRVRVTLTPLGGLLDSTIFKTQRAQIAVTIVALGLAAFGLSRLLPEPVAVGALAPSFEAVGLSTGQSVKVPDITRGRLTLVSFWSRACKYCPVQFAELDSIARIFGPRGLAVVAVSIDPEESAIARDSLRLAAVSLDSTIIAVHEPSGYAQRRYIVEGTPETLLLDPAGRVLCRVIGTGMSRSPALLALLERRLAPAPARQAGRGSVAAPDRPIFCAVITRSRLVPSHHPIHT